MVLVYPNIHVNTTDAYSGVRPQKAFSSLENNILKLPVNKWKGIIQNDFEGSVFVKFPEIEQVKKKLYENGALYASMSGSGSAVYGLFEKEVELKSQFEDYFVWQKKM